MTVIISHRTALEFWRANPELAKSAMCDAPPGCLCSLKLNEHNSTMIRQLTGIPDEQPIDVLVKSARNRHKVPGIACHCFSNALPEHSLFPLTESMLIASPELCFLQLAYSQSTLESTLLAYELCGTYTHCGNQTRYNETPVTTVERLQGFIGKLSGISRIAKTRSSLLHALDGSASPRETELILRLCMPVRLGGYGLPHPKLNEQINFSPESTTLGMRSYCRGDLCWPAQKFTLEYDSNEHHAGVGSLNSDSMRRNALKYDGHDVVTVTFDQISDTRRFDVLARLTAKSIGHRLRMDKQCHLPKAAKLQRDILSCEKSLRKG